MSDVTSTWRLPIALVALATIPVIAGSLRLIDLATGSTVMPLNPRFSATPLPVSGHATSNDITSPGWAWFWSSA